MRLAERPSWLTTEPTTTPASLTSLVTRDVFRITRTAVASPRPYPLASRSSVRDRPSSEIIDAIDRLRMTSGARESIALPTSTLLGAGVSCASMDVAM